MIPERQKYFTLEEAATRIGRRIVTTIDFSGVPKGTEGKVLEP